ncbi:Acyl-CoA synthetase short-chain family member 3, mitochondrial [Zancudomyces culisetae]|uniref:Acyl-CoA synthetase short-chain family member 3, mitochondrial n=1 Tax=Zancudomyces culisetae TaxID=1213189 RepID=A0A1R1PWL0_ZANCU|nr:Acyl-CoA synthetase short-chain family member 3, mitochondrial [Zancudomyces culisetae]|eukprot:OMH85370.1 Acyl-CoA synthetase short-chain family member 3, mitochondrial [Zancudomyces culisetae]
MLACTRIGAIHSVVFGGFASPELAKRINNCKPKVVLSATCGIERSDKIVKYIPLLSKALKISKHKPKAVIVYQREQLPVLLDLKLGFKCWYEEVASVQELTDAPSAVVDSNHPLYILCTSGTTGLPKGVIRPCGPHLVSLSWTIRNMFGIKPGEVFFCASDLGWVVGHTFTCYGPLLEGCTTVLYEGKPVKTPDAGSFFRVIQEYGASIFYTAPTALVVLRKEDKEHNIVRKYNLDSIRGYFMAGERCSTEIYKWWVEHTTGKRVDGERYHYDEIKGIAVDHWWQTESGSPMTGICIGVSEDPKEIAPIQFGSAGMPLAGVDLRVVKAKDHLNEDEVVHSHIEEADFNEVGDIVVKLPLPPGFFTGIWENKKVFFSSYFRKYPGYYDTGDMGFVDKDGYVHITSRCDDVINVAAHRFSTCTFEEVVLEQNGISEACVVGRPHDIKGQIPIIFAVLEKNMSAKEKSELVRSIVTKIRADIGPVASMLPENVIFVPRLPKNRSGKILRRTIRVLIDYAGKHRNDLSEKLPIPMPPTIEDPDVLKDTWLIIASLVNPGSVELRSKM